MIRKLKLLCLIIGAVVNYKKAIYFWNIGYDTNIYLSHNKDGYGLTVDEIQRKYEKKVLQYATEFAWGRR